MTTEISSNDLRRIVWLDDLPRAAWVVFSSVWNIGMRLTDRQRDIIRDAGLRHFGVVPRLFGSRLDDRARGGDIDLFIPGDWSAERSVPRRLRFCAELRQRLGDQKIDVVVEKVPESSVQRLAKQQGEPV